MNVLRRGGSAVDAAIAVAGDAVAGRAAKLRPRRRRLHDLLRRARRGRVTVYDGRETAPAGATPDMFLDDDGQPLPFARGGAERPRHRRPRRRADARPRASRAWPAAVEQPVRRCRADRARRLHRQPAPRPDDRRPLPQNSAPDVRAYFARRPTAPCSMPATRCATRLMPISSAASPPQGPDALYRGPTARRIVARLHEGELPGAMTLADLAAYRPVERAAAVPAVSASIVICVPPPPSSGVGLLQLMAMLERTDIARARPADPQAWFLFAEASRLMYADRDQYVGDPAFAAVPVDGLLDPAYVARAPALIGDARRPAARRRNAARRAARPAPTRHCEAGRHHAISSIGDARGQCRVDDRRRSNRSSARAGWSTASSSTTR